VDDNFPANKKQTDQLLERMGEWAKNRGYPFFFAANTSLNLADDDQLLKHLKEADFRYLSLGIETAENRVLKMAQKDHCINVPIVEVVKKIHSYGIAVDASYIIGFDNESDESAALLRDSIQDSGICMAMIGTLYALPNTALARRLEREGRLFPESSTIKDSYTEIDQMSSGLNFVTARPRTEILQDYVETLEYIYDPSNYFSRIIRLSLQIRPGYKYRHPLKKGIKMARSFLLICAKLGLNKRTRALYWKMFFTVLFRRPAAIEVALTFAALFIHLSRHAQFIEELTRNKIRQIELLGEERYNEWMLSGEYR
jgi:radical SAM superfamily enzyme YgiQ (UPF0313 family)